MSAARSSGFSITLVLMLAGCGSGSSSSLAAGSTGSGGSTTSASSSTATSASTTTTSASSSTTTTSASSTTTTSSGTTTTTTAFMCAGVNGCMAPVCPPDLTNAKMATSGPGIVLTWTEAQACDTVQIESAYGLTGFPSQMTPPGAPQFTLPGTTLTVTDTSATMPNNYTYHMRCVVGGVDSCWSNEVAAMGHM